jgi:hypothetical protein
VGSVNDFKCPICGEWLETDEECLNCGTIKVYKKETEKRKGELNEQRPERMDRRRQDWHRPQD